MPLNAQEAASGGSDLRGASCDMSELAALSRKVSAAAEAIQGERPPQISPKLGQVDAVF